MKIPVVLGLGSNRSIEKLDEEINTETNEEFDKVKNEILTPSQILQYACNRLSGILENMMCSSLYTTKPMYVTDQDDFFNMAVFGFFKGTPHELLEKTQKIENDFGRNRQNEIRNGPRTLDIDIELFGNQKIIDADLVVPHPRLKERAFILIPLLEILPKDADIPHRDLFEQYLKQLPDQGVQLYGRCNNS